jgi:hypothetical protein
MTLFWVWRDTGEGYRVVSSDRTPRRVTSMKPCLEAATYEVLANFFLQEGRNAALRAADEGYKPKAAVDTTKGETPPSSDLEKELLDRVYRQNRITP